MKKIFEKFLQWLIGIFYKDSITEYEVTLQNRIKNKKYKIPDRIISYKDLDDTIFSGIKENRFVILRDLLRCVVIVITEDKNIQNTKFIVNDKMSLCALYITSGEYNKDEGIKVNIPCSLPNRTPCKIKLINKIVYSFIKKFVIKNETKEILNTFVHIHSREKKEDYTNEFFKSLKKFKEKDFDLCKWIKYSVFALTSTKSYIQFRFENNDLVIFVDNDTSDEEIEILDFYFNNIMNLKSIDFPYDITIRRFSDGIKIQTSLGVN